MPLRQIKAITLPDLTPAAISDPLPEIRWVHPNTLWIDEKYQRNLSERSITLIRRIVAEWDWAAFTPPKAAEVDGRLHVTDGQHTAIAAASHPTIELIPVLVASAAEEQHRAMDFVRHNRDRVQVTPTQLHLAMVAAGDPDAVTVAQVCDRAGVTILKAVPANGAFKEGQTMAVAALRKLVSHRYAIGARKVLDVCVAAKLVPISAEAIKAVELILYGEEYVGHVESDALVAAIRRMGPEAEKEAVVFAAAHKVQRWKALAIVWFRNTRKKRNG
ncbi:DUF6551 family protein [Pleomorphomonas koreensis]|uniref:DUF6551 family protein n=1 Tax=Pleomorphomonas koreensis TaxID=257440 RepID=UPI00047A24AA|nr:DUF6551 family protein [Pleomorphomonas koreensis]